jgi:hypothetical protein
MLRSDHRIMIEQNVDGENHWTTIRLIDKQESKDGSSVTGSWKHTSESYNDEEITFTSAHPQYLYWEWKGGPHGGNFSIGVKMGRASHKAGEDEIFQVLITLDLAKRMANGAFRVGSVLGNGSGRLTYDVNPHFKKGDITWTVVRYER